MVDTTPAPTAGSTTTPNRELHRLTSADDRRDEVETEYGTYIAVQDIDLQGVRAFNRGDAVPVSHVDRGIVGSEFVAKRTTKAARSAANQAGGLDTEE